MKKRLLASSTIVIAAILLHPFALVAQAPQLINFQAQLNGGSTLPSPTVIVFTIYDAESGGNELWSESQRIVHTNGVFSTLLGSRTPFSDDIFQSDGERYLDMVVEGNNLPERFRLTSVAYALRADVADRTGPMGIRFPDGTVQATAATSGGTGPDNDWIVDANENMYPAVSGNVGIGTVVPSNRLSVAGAADFQEGIFSGGNEGRAVTLFSPGENDTRDITFINIAETQWRIDQVGSAPALRFSTRAGDGAFTPRVFFQGDGRVGIGIENPEQALSVNGAIQSTAGGFVFPDGTTQTTAASSTPSIGETLAVGIDDVNGVGNFDTSILTLAGEQGREDVIHQYAGPNARQPAYVFVASDGTQEAPAVVAANKPLGGILSTAFNGSFYRTVSSISFGVDGAPNEGTGIIPGRLTLRTTSVNGAGGVFSTRLHLNSRGQIGVNTVNPTNTLSVAGDADFNQGIFRGNVNDAITIVNENGTDTPDLVFRAQNTTENFWRIDMAGDSPFLRFSRSGPGLFTPRMVLHAETGFVGIGQNNPGHPLEMGSGAHVTEGGVWTNASSRSLKENIAPLNADDALAALLELVPMRYNYTAEPDEDYLGFIAEDVPELVAQQDRRSLSAMDIVALLTKVVQQQQQEIEALKSRLDQ